MKNHKKLSLKTETVRVLTTKALERVAGGWTITSTSYHGGECTSGQVSCDTACTSSLSG